MKAQYKFGYLAIIFVFIVSFPIQAADKDENVITYRKRVMSSIGALNGSMGDILKGKVSYNNLMPYYAKALHEVSQTVLTTFKQDTRESTKKNRSKEEIWTEWEDFEKATQNFVDASAQLVTATESGDMGKIGAAMKAVGKSCGGCHKKFRAKRR